MFRSFCILCLLAAVTSSASGQTKKADLKRAETLRQEISSLKKKLAAAEKELDEIEPKVKVGAKKDIVDKAIATPAALNTAASQILQVTRNAMFGGNQIIYQQSIEAAKKELAKTEGRSIAWKISVRFVDKEGKIHFNLDFNGGVEILDTEFEVSDLDATKVVSGTPAVIRGEIESAVFANRGEGIGTPVRIRLKDAVISAK